MTAQSGSRAISSITFAAVVWDADEPCSVKTALAPESFVFYNVTTLLLYFCDFGYDSASSRWHLSINVLKWTFFWNQSARSLTFSSYHAGIVSSFFHSLSTAAFATGIFIAWSIGINYEPRCDGSPKCTASRISFGIMCLMEFAFTSSSSSAGLPRWNSFRLLSHR